MRGERKAFPKFMQSFYPCSVDADSDIDLMVLADDLSYGALFTALEDAGVTLGRPVNPTILSRDEFHDRVANQESFLTRVMEQPKIWILGKEGDLSI